MNNLLSISLHSVSFASACGAINKQSTVLAVKEGIAKHFSVALLEDFGLCRVLIKHFFEAKYFRIIWVRYTTFFHA
jgi:hypothetical protein